MNQFGGTDLHPYSHNNESEELSDSELHILRHSLGISHDPKAKIYRNRFITTPDTVDYPICKKLCDMGYMHLFVVTQAGIKKAT